MSTQPSETNATTATAMCPHCGEEYNRKIGSPTGTGTVFPCCERG